MRPGLPLPSSLHASSAFSVALLGGVAAYVVLLLGDVGGGGYDALRDVFFYNALLVAAALFCLARPVFRSDARLPWTLVGLGLLAWVIGDLYYELAFANADEVPFPSLADGFYLLLYPLVYAGLALLLYSRLEDIRTDLWVDGVIAALAIAAVGAALVFDVIVETTGGDFWTVWTNMAYVIADLGLIGVVTFVLAITGWHLDRSWIFVLVGCFVFSVADTAYLYATATETYQEGALMDAGWLAGIALIAVAAWQPRRPVVAVRVDGFWAFALPTAFGTLALGLLVYDHFRALHTIALVLSGAAVAAVIVRMVLTFRRNAHLLETSRRDAETDELTGLANRRLLLHDLENRIEAGVPTLLLMFDLDGFKSYNDAFGHGAGDALLHRLAMRLGRGRGAVRARIPHGRRRVLRRRRRRQSRPRPDHLRRSQGASRRGRRLSDQLRVRRGDAAGRGDASSPRRSGSRTPGCTATRTAAARPPAGRRARCSSASSTSATRTSVATSRPWPGSPGRWARRSACPTPSSTT